jgi:hypothetical protein
MHSGGDIMKKTIIAILSAAMLIAVCGCSANSLFEKETQYMSITYPIYKDIYGMTEKATDIVLGRVTNQRVEELDLTIYPESEEELNNELLYPGGYPSPHFVTCTIYTLIISEVYKGNHEAGAVIEIKELGGETDDVIYVVYPAVTLAVENDYVLFLSSYEKLPASLLNPLQGAYVVNNRTRSASDMLTCVGEDSRFHLPLTFDDLNAIAAENDFPKAE